MAANAFDRRRPPGLLDAAMQAASSGKSTSSVNTCDADFGRSNEFEACMQRLRLALDSVFEQHRDEMQHTTRLWSARQSGAWRSADSFSRSKSSSLDVSGVRREQPGAWPVTPKLDPPRRSQTPVNTTDILRGLAKERDSFAIPELLIRDDVESSQSSSTRCDSHSGLDISQSFVDDNIECTVLDSQCCSAAPSLPTPPRPPTAAWRFTEMQSTGEKDQGPTLLGICNDSSNFSPKASSTSRTTAGRRQQGSIFSPLSRRKKELLDVFQSPLEQMLRSHTYKSWNVFVIVLNAAFIVWETENRAKWALLGRSATDLQGNEVSVTVAANIFVVIFVVDIVLHLLSQGWETFILGKEKYWNMFDVVVTLIAAVEVIVQWFWYASSTSDASFNLRMHLAKFSMLRMVRLLHIIQTTRSVKLVRFIRDLRLMVISLGAAIKPLFWSVVLMLIIILIFGVSFTDGAVAYCMQHVALDGADTRLLRQYFGTLSTSTLSLYMSISGGEDWANIFHALECLSFEYRLLFLLFVTFAILALLNVVTAVFVGTAMQRSQHDTELMIQQELDNKDEFIATLQRVFDELDVNSRGSLSVDEFEHYINYEKVKAYLRTLDINISQARTLFILLDENHTGVVDIDEFASGLARLKGGATSIDMAVLKYQVDSIHHAVMQLNTNIDKQVPAGRVSRVCDDARTLLSR